VLKIALIDNYDSFTYNLKHYLETDAEVTVIRNDKVVMDALLSYDLIVLSPGPGLPKDAGKLMEVIATYYNRIPILGICLGMQAISEFFEARLYNLKFVKHGLSSKLSWYDKEAVLYNGLTGDIQVGRYHSWAVDPESLPNHLEITARTEDAIMSIVSTKYPLTGIQYHPESILSPKGKQILKNWLEQYKTER